MASLLATYDFLTLALLFLAPGALAWAWRPDLRPWMWRSALAALPFAATERLFYPTYWSPHFLFGLITKIGFGLEDLIFLAGLASFTTTAYPFAFRRALERREPPSLSRSFARALAPTALALGLALPLVALGAPVIYASVRSRAAEPPRRAPLDARLRRHLPALRRALARRLPPRLAHRALPRSFRARPAPRRAALRLGRGLGGGRLRALRVRATLYALPCFAAASSINWPMAGDLFQSKADGSKAIYRPRPQHRC